MDTYVIVRRNCWLTPAEATTATDRSGEESAGMPGDAVWIRSYILTERDGTLGAVCVFHGSSPEAIRRHVAAADVPIDEIVEVEEVIVVRPDSVPVRT